MLADSMRHQFLTPEHLLLAITALPAWKKCAASMPEANVIFFVFELCNYINEMEQTPEDILEEIRQTQEYHGIPVSDLMQELFNRIELQCAYSEREEADIEHAMHALFHLDGSTASYLLNSIVSDRGGFIGAFTHENRTAPGSSPTAEELLEKMSKSLEEEESTGNSMSLDPDQLHGDFDTHGWMSDGYDSSRDWHEEVVCLNDIVDRRNPLIGREKELERTIQVLCRKEKNNPLHIGEPGVGKTAIVYGLTRMINEGRVPARLKGAKIYRMEMGGLVAGTRYRGDFEEKLRNILEGAAKEQNAILYIDEIHTMMGAGASSESSLDASNILKRYLEEGNLRFIGATTFEDHKRSMGRNRAVSRRFQEIEICEPSVEETTRILTQLQKGYEDFHGVSYAPGVMEFAAKMSALHIHGRFLPDKALDLIDEAGAWRELNPSEDGSCMVDEALIAEVLSKIARVDALAMTEEKTENTRSLAERILKSVYGQDEAVTDVAESVLMARAGLTDENRPMGCFLFVGPTGVGKTELAKVLAKEMGIGLVRFDMSEYAEKHAIAKLIGSPAGYVGYEDGGLLTDAIIKQPNCVLLLDEIEKAHADIYDILLQVMDNGRLTDNRGREADFSHVVLIMTSNAGARFASRASVGFGSHVSAGQAMLKEVKKTFKPEFINRLTAIEVFNDMDPHMADMILDKALRGLLGKLKAKGVELIITESAREALLKEGMTRDYGARELHRVIERRLTKPLSHEILFGTLTDGGTAHVDTDADSNLTISSNPSRHLPTENR
ncbi:MAG: AAA family ATPase [Muribaculaceae bacterium]|nr:AAA family ATPase [Muribaculaceae bacterium]